MKRVNNQRPLLKKRKELRRALTPAEAKLWSCLKNDQLVGRKFRRQHSIDTYIVDFYCASEKLAVELDGEVHNNPSSRMHDVERDANLLKHGIHVLRFENKSVFEDLENVLLTIAACLRERNKPLRPVGPPPLSRGGARAAERRDAAGAATS